MRQRGRIVEEENGLTNSFVLYSWDIVSQMEKHVFNGNLNVVVLKSRNNDKALCSFSGPLIHRFAVKVQKSSSKE